MNRRKLIFGSLAVGIAFVLAAAIAAFRFLQGSAQYPPIGSVTRIEVRIANKPFKKIEDPSTVRGFVDYVDAHRTGWGGLNDVFGVPVPVVVADLYDGATFRGHVGLGPNFLEAQRAGDFSSRSITNADGREFLRVLDVPESAAHR